MTRPVVILCACVALAACRGRHETAGTVSPSRIPAAVVATRQAQQARAAEELARGVPAEGAPKQILFGDLHVHTTFSIDAFLRSLPMLQGEGAHPPADACDFARFCSGLDFWAITDHAEAISPQHWQETKESIRQCNAMSGDAQRPDVVAFVGWEWTQVGLTPGEHYGHKNVIFRDTDDSRVPARPISALSERLVGGLRTPQPIWQRLRFPLLDWSNRQRYFDFGRFQEELRDVPSCPGGIDTRQLAPGCHEAAQTPQELFEKLSQWGFDVLVIPHGTTWGFYTPAGSSLDKQLTAAQHDPQKQSLFEVYSGHGNSEEYRDWRAVSTDADGGEMCPEPTRDYVPCCWQAGEIIRARCGDLPADECERRVVAARAAYLAAGVAGHLTVPGATVDDWKDCGQCRDCYNPAFNYRPANSAQYALALSNFDDPTGPRRFRFGFVASSDNHTARPGTGYKEYGRRMMTEAAGARDETWYGRIAVPRRAPEAAAQPLASESTAVHVFQLAETERQASFFMTGGLVAAHASGRDRNAIWDALKRREVYGTSGDRILLWFDLLNGPDGPAPMGAEVRLHDTPRFRVRAVGAFAQLPGCPDYTTALPSDRLERLCRGECYNPGGERRLIRRIEVVRIRPQEHRGEPVRPLIEDPWKRIDCPADPAGCVAEFDDPDFVPGAREVAYYVRAIQEPTPAVNAANLRCRYDERGECVEVHPCFGDYRTRYEDDCLAPNEERAWSSPIYVATEPLA